MLTKALLVGNFSAAVNICINTGRMVGDQAINTCTCTMLLVRCVFIDSWYIYYYYL